MSTNVISCGGSHPLTLCSCVWTSSALVVRYVIAAYDSQSGSSGDLVEVAHIKLSQDDGKVVAVLGLQGVHVKYLPPPGTPVPPASHEELAEYHQLMEQRKQQQPQQPRSKL